MQVPDLSNVPMGATLVPGGATFRVWAPRALAVHVCGDFNGWKPDATRLAPIGGGHWVGFVPGLKDGDQYLFYVDGKGTSGFKRDARARVLTFAPAFPLANCVLRDPTLFPWHASRYSPPAFSDLIIYQLHVGTFLIQPGQGDGSFLDVIARVPYLASVGVNAIELLPVQEFPTTFSLGYNGIDLFSPENDYGEASEPQLKAYFEAVNAVLHAAGQAPYPSLDVLRGSDNQLRALIDVCHVHGLAVIFDVVYNHAGGGFDDQSIWFYDRMPFGNANDSLYFTDQGWAGGQVFAYWNNDVAQYLIDNARFFYREYRIDGFRFDEVSVMDRFGGWRMCQNLTATLRAENPAAVQIAEYWPVNEAVVRPTAEGGGGFDASWNSGLRDAVRGAIQAAAGGGNSVVAMDAIADALAAVPLRNRWRAVQAVENHDIVYTGRAPRIPRLADGSNARSWYARSRSRVALGLVLTAPGIPLLFMGQEILEDKPWSDTPDPGTMVWWAGLAGGDKAMADFLHFTRDLAALRSSHPALRGEGCAIIHVHNDNRVLAFQRWVEGVGNDVVVVASLRDTTWYDYRIGFPSAGAWAELFNSDVYDNWVNPLVAGNGGGVQADGPPMHGMPSSASLTIPANGLLVFARR